MKAKANPALVGVFVIVAVVIVVGALILLRGYDFFSTRQEFVAYFLDSVNGLEVGAPVKFKGVTIGEVTDIGVDFQESKGMAFIPVVIETKRPTRASQARKVISASVEVDKYVKDGLCARLVMQSYLTGKLYVELDFAEDDRTVFFLGGRTPYRQIPTAVSDVQEIWDRLTKILESLGGVNFEEMAGNVNRVLVGLGEGVEGIKFREINEKVEGFLEKGGRAFEGVEGMVGRESGFRGEVEEALRQVGRAARVVRELGEYLMRHPNALVVGRGEEKKEEGKLKQEGK